MPLDAGGAASGDWVRTDCTTSTIAVLAIAAWRSSSTSDEWLASGTVRRALFADRRVSSACSGSQPSRASFSAVTAMTGVSPSDVSCCARPMTVGSAAISSRMLRAWPAVEPKARSAARASSGSDPPLNWLTSRRTPKRAADGATPLAFWKPA